MISSPPARFFVLCENREKQACGHAASSTKGKGVRSGDDFKAPDTPEAEGIVERGKYPWSQAGELVAYGGV